MKLAVSTGGKYFAADTANKLIEDFSHMQTETADFYKDSDNDGINDYYEKEMAAGRLRLGTGVPLTNISYLNPDSDGDGLLDGDEVNITKINIPFFGSYVHVMMSSDPAKPDTDKDGYTDNNDCTPIKVGYR